MLANSRRCLTCPGIRLAEVAEVLADVRREILLAEEQDHRILRQTLVHLDGHQSYPGVAGTEQWDSVVDRAETVVGVVGQGSQFAWDTEIPAGPTETWWRVNTINAS